jgi:hypothetical protein
MCTPNLFGLLIGNLSPILFGLLKQNKFIT